MMLLKTLKQMFSHGWRYEILEDGGIRFFAPGSDYEFCMLTALCFATTGKRHDIIEFDKAVSDLGISPLREVFVFTANDSDSWFLPWVKPMRAVWFYVINRALKRAEQIPALIAPIAS